MALSLGIVSFFSATGFSPGPQATQPLALAGRARRATDVVSTIAVFGASGGQMCAIKKRGSIKSETSPAPPHACSSR